MNWQNATYLWGTLLAAVPLLIHLLKRRPQRPKAIPSLMWLAVQPAKNRRLRQWSDLIVLFFRMLTIVLVFLALAGPQFGSGRVVKVLVQNEPALWDRRAQWLPNAFDQLPESERFELHSLQGIIGIFSPEEAREVAMALPAVASVNKLDRGQDYTLSAGFSPLDTAVGAVVLPDRPVMTNAFLEWHPSSQTLRLAGDTLHVQGEVTASITSFSNGA